MKKIISSLMIMGCAVTAFAQTVTPSAPIDGAPTAVGRDRSVTAPAFNGDVRSTAPALRYEGGYTQETSVRREAAPARSCQRNQPFPVNRQIEILPDNVNRNVEVLPYDVNPGAAGAVGKPVNPLPQPFNPPKAPARSY